MQVTGCSVDIIYDTPALSGGFLSEVHSNTVVLLLLTNHLLFVGIVCLVLVFNAVLSVFSSL